MAGPETIRPSGASLGPGGEQAVAAVASAGGVIVFPTESFYALGAAASSPEGVRRVFRLKSRPPSMPLLLLLASPEEVPRYAAAPLPGPARGLMERFWPGPLTLLVPARPGLAPGLVSAAGEVALRVPGGALCRAVVKAAGGALTGTSANRSGSPPPVEAAVARQGLGGPVALVVEAGTLPGGEVSTILALRRGGVEVLREGAVPREELMGFLEEKRLE